MGVSFNQQKKMKLFGLWLSAAWSLPTSVCRPNPIPNLSAKSCQFVMAMNALGLERNAKRTEKLAADLCGAMEPQHHTTAKTIAAHVGEDHAEAMEKHAAKVSLAKVMEFVHH